MVNKCKKILLTICVIPQRYIVGIMGCFALINAYTMRISLSMAITEMVAPINVTETVSKDACPEVGHANASVGVKDRRKLYEWDESTQGIILSGFYYGYLITHLPGGVLADKFGGKQTLAAGILSTSIFTLLTPLVIVVTNGDWRILTVLRVVEGLGEGVTYPALSVMLAKWVPLKERGKIGTIVYAGAQMGTIISNLLSGYIIYITKDWEWVFYVFGISGVLWVIFWQLLVYSNPEAHPFISDKERDYLQEEIENVGGEKLKIPWKAILTSVPLWALVAAQIGHDWGFFTMVTDLPKYLKDILKYNVKENAVWSTLPYVGMWIVSMISGVIADFLINREHVSVTNTRKLFTSIGSLFPAIFIMAASYSGCNRLLAVLMFTIAMTMMGAFYSGMKVNSLDLSPNFSGTLMAIVNGIGAITGMIAPHLCGVLTEGHTLTQWRTVLWIGFAVFNVTNVIYIFFASGKEQWWNAPDAVNPNTVNA